jgi:hypothetical protein
MNAAEHDPMKRYRAGVLTLAVSLTSLLSFGCVELTLLYLMSQRKGNGTTITPDG